MWKKSKSHNDKLKHEVFRINTKKHNNLNNKGNLIHMNPLAFYIEPNKLKMWCSSPEMELFRIKIT